MTKREALEKSIEMWTCIKDNQIAYKDDYFVDKEPVKHLCYLCEYANTQLNFVLQGVNPTCYESNLCPVKNWNLEDGELISDCLDRYSPYYQYDYDNKYAYEIADDMLLVLNRALNELEEEDD